jgi:hypothetical protein
MSDQQSIKEIIKGELVRCSYDPAYFIKKYVYISHPIKGTIPFNLYLFQEKTLEQFQKLFTKNTKRNDNIILNLFS